MRVADAQNTMALVQLHRGDVGGAIDYGNRALDHDRRCIPSLLSSTRDIVVLPQREHPREPAVQGFRDRVVRSAARLATSLQRPPETDRPRPAQRSSAAASVSALRPLPCGVAILTDQSI